MGFVWALCPGALASIVEGLFGGQCASDCIRRPLRVLLKILEVFSLVVIAIASPWINLHASMVGVGNVSVMTLSVASRSCQKKIVARKCIG